MQRRLLLASTVALYSACSSDDDEHTNLNVIADNSRTPGNVQDPIVFGLPPFSDLRLYVLRAEAEWAAFWEAIQPLEGPKQPAPAVNFTNQLVVGVFTGAKPNSCFDVAITNARKEGDTLVVRYQQTIPSAFSFGGCLPVGVYPFRLAIVDATPKTVQFEEGARIVI